MDQPQKNSQIAFGAQSETRTMTGRCIRLFERSKKMGLHLREETEEHRAFTEELYAATRAEELRSVPWQAAEKAAFLSWQHDAQRSHYKQNYPEADWFIVERGQRPVGRLYIAKWSTEIRIIDIAFVEDARGKGFGTSLLLDILDEAERIDTCVTIHVEEFNRARFLYHRIGFRVLEEKGVYLLFGWCPSKIKTRTSIHMPNDRWLGQVLEQSEDLKPVPVA